MKIVKNFGGGVTPKKLKLKNRENAFFRTGMKTVTVGLSHLCEKKFLGVEVPLDPKIWGPPNFSTFRRYLNIV